MKPSDLEYMVAYQIGALQGMACYAGLKVTHLKPHGALNNMAAEDEDYAMAIGRAIKTVDKDIIYVALYGSQMQKAAEKLGLRLAREGFVDRKYDDDGNLASRAISGTVLKDPQAAIENTLRMVQENEVVADVGQAREGEYRHLLRPWGRGHRRRGRGSCSQGARNRGRQGGAAHGNEALGFF